MCSTLPTICCVARSAGIADGANVWRIDSGNLLSYRYMDWQRSLLMPIQEMFGQVGIGRYWECEPAPIEVGMAAQSKPQQRQDGARAGSPDADSGHAVRCKPDTESWVSRHSRSAQMSLNRAQSIPARV